MLAIAPATAVSRSASSKTMNGALPPSSKDSFLRVEEDCFMRSLPTPVEPVKETFLTMGDVVRTSPTSAVFFNALTKLTTPLGIPARCASSAMARDVNGVSPGDLATTVQPAARAGPIFRVIIAAGKFHLETSASPSYYRSLYSRGDETADSNRLFQRDDSISCN